MFDEKNLPQWFNLRSQDDEFIVFEFLRTLLENLDNFFLQNSFLHVINKVDQSNFDNITLTDFYAAFQQAREIYTPGYIQLLSFYDSPSSLEEFKSRLTRIGFTGKSLRLKGNLLNKAWEKIERFGDRIIDFSKKSVVKQVVSFLKILNNILGSLMKELPFVEIVKEWKECGEAYIDIAEKEA